MRKVLLSSALATLLVLPQAAPALAHSTRVNATTEEGDVSLQIGRQEQQAVEGLRVVVSDDGVVANLSTHNHDDDGGLLEQILGGFDNVDGNEDDALLGIFDYDEEEDEDRDGLFSIFDHDEENDEDRDGLLGDIL